jgi:hypothetical protein
MKLLTLAVYLPIAAVGLVFVYLMMGWGGIALVFVALIFKFLPQPKTSKD